MTQVAEKLLEYMQSEYESQGTTRFTAQGIFLESNIDFGGIDAITRAATELEECGKIFLPKTLVLALNYSNQQLWRSCSIKTAFSALLSRTLIPLVPFLSNP